MASATGTFPGLSGRPAARCDGPAFPGGSAEGARMRGGVNLT